MSQLPDPDRDLPSRRQAALFQGKVALLQARRTLADLGMPVSRQVSGNELVDAPIVSEASSEVWTHQQAEEFPLTAGKVQNLRVACESLNGLEIRAGETFSFWKQIGRTTRYKGYTSGRELREGCLVANIGGGLCQLSNLLYNVALDGGLEILERHAHSRLIPGSLGEMDRDATVFWNYVDLRFRADFACRLETILTSTELTVRVRARDASKAKVEKPSDSVVNGAPIRSRASGDCATCGMTECFRNPAAVSANQPTSGHSAFLLDEYWPEFQEWCRNHSVENDRWLLPLDGHRWKKPNYTWSAPDSTKIEYATVQILRAAFQARRLPAQGATRQRALLNRDRALAEFYRRKLDSTARHLIVSQNLLPHLWKQGTLGGRTFDVLMTRWPLVELQRRLNTAAQKHSDSSTLADFRVDESFVALESEALASAARLITPHRAIAAYFGDRALLLDWQFPEPDDESVRRSPDRLFFPASPLGRKGIYELAAALREWEVELLVLGDAREGSPDPLDSLSHRKASREDLFGSAALVLPAWIEHQPRLALRALANKIPVIASAACGLPDHPYLREIDEPDCDAIRARLSEVLSSESGKPESLKK